MIAQGFLGALHNFASPELWLWLMAGIVFGLVLGILPGISGMTGNILTLPFVFFMEPLQAFPFMLGTATVSMAGGAVTTILIGVPGDSINIATLIDGYPMTQKGEGARALGAAFTASGLGSVVGGFLALGVIPLLLPMILAMGSADLFFMILAGLAFIGVLSTGSMLKGLIAGAFGIVLAFVGLETGSLIERFTFGSPYLYRGLPTIPVLLGLFGMPPLIDMIVHGGTIAKVEAQLKGMAGVFEGVKDVFRHWGVFLRSSVIGYLVGCIPGLGQPTAIWVAYGQAKATSKHPEKFGNGAVEGVIAPQSASDATEGGSLMTTLALGIPLNPHMAIYYSALLMLNITPGPSMLTTHLDLTITLIYITIIASVIGEMAFCFAFAPQMARLAYMPARFLVPIVIVMMFVGTFVYQGYFGDLLTLVVFTALGLAIRHFGYNAAAMIVGFLLGRPLEQAFFIALPVGGPFFFMRPISLTIIFLVVALFAYKPISRVVRRYYQKRLEGIKPRR